MIFTYIYLFYYLQRPDEESISFVSTYLSVKRRSDFFSVRRAVLFNMSVSAVWLDMRGLPKKKIPEYRYSELPMKKRGDRLFPKPVDTVNTHT